MSNSYIPYSTISNIRCNPLTHYFAYFTILKNTLFLNVYNDHSRDQVMVVSVDRWSLYRGASVSLRWPMEQPTVVSIDRWSFYTRGLSDRSHCTVYIET